MPAAASNEKSEFACAHMRSCHRTLSLMRMRGTRACEARAPRRAGWSRSISYESTLRQRNGPLARCTAVFHTCQPRPPTSSLLVYVRKENSATARALSLERESAARALAARVRRAALVGVGPYPIKPHCASETSLSFGERPCSGMPAAASSEKSEFACVHTRLHHHTLSLRRRSSTRACEVRAPRRAGLSRYIAYGSTRRQRNGPFARCTGVF